MERHSSALSVKGKGGEKRGWSPVPVKETSRGGEKTLVLTRSYEEGEITSQKKRKKVPRAVRTKDHVGSQCGDQKLREVP